MARPGLLLAICLIGFQAQAQDWSGRVRLQLGQEYDSNAIRENTPKAPEDFLTRLVAQGRFACKFDDHHLWLDYQGGGKIFYQQQEENQVASRLQAGYRLRLPHDRSVGLRLVLRDVTQARHSLDYMQTGGDVFLTMRPLPGLALEAWLGGRHYNFKPDGKAVIVVDQATSDDEVEILFSNAGPTLGLQLHAALGSAWSLGLSYRFGVRFYQDAAYDYLEVGTPEAATCNPVHEEVESGCYTPTGRDREDFRNAGSASVRVKTAWLAEHQFIAQASYNLTHNLSNSTGNSAIWHRFRAVISMQLPLDLTLHLMGTVQVTNYPDGRTLLLDFYEPDADENENTFVARVSWRFWDELSLVAQAAIYRNEFQFGTAEQAAFKRETYLLGLAWDTSF